MKPVLKIALLILFFISCNKENSEVAPTNSIPTTCRLASVTSVTDANKTSTATYEYDAKNRLVKFTNSNSTITYEYDQNDFLLKRVWRPAATVSTTDIFTYKNEKISNIEKTQTIGTTIIITKTAYEYAADGSLAKISVIDGNNNSTVSIFSKNILTEQTSNIYAFEVNSLGLITKTTLKVSDSFSTAGQYTQYTYDENGQLVKSENVDKNGVIVQRVEIEYTTLKDLQLSPVVFEAGSLAYNNIKGFPVIGKLQPKFIAKKETTFLLNRTSNTLVEWVSFTYENHKVDKYGLLLSNSLLYKTTTSTNTSNTTYTYSGCN